ncbi:MAG: hypothetical protein LBP59_15860 [Planctomycetaceae bacterium]|nr:hypothetical protein [Planctomycetaceae bacterium]
MLNVLVILLVLEIQRFKSVKACRPKSRQAKVNENSSANSLKGSQPPQLPAFLSNLSIITAFIKLQINNDFLAILCCCYSVGHL